MCLLRKYFDNFCDFIGTLLLIAIGGTIGGTVLCVVLLASAPLAIVLGLLIIFGLQFNLNKIGDVVEANIAKSKMKPRTIKGFQKQVPYRVRFEACQPCREKHEICQMRDGDTYYTSDAAALKIPEDCMCVFVPVGLDEETAP